VGTSRRWYDAWLRFLYWFTAFSSAALLFLIQPVLAKALLPHFGGSASVWTAALFFFQAMVVLGYLWAFAIERLSPLAGRLLHVGILLLSMLWLPIHPVLPAAGDPLLSVLLTLARNVGLPCFALCATSPLIQAWYGTRFHGAIPWRVFAISNLASLVGLLCYPFVLEPWLGNAAQLRIWSWAFGVFAICCIASALAGPFQRAVAQHARVKTSSWWLWVALGAAPSALWMACANHLSQTVAPLPLLWIYLLSVYLLSFMLCFSPLSPYRRQPMRWLLPAGVVSIVAAIQWSSISTSLLAILLLFSAGLFLCCLFCHGELYERRPPQTQLTQFYLAVALGGVLGAAFTGIAAPQIFDSILELPIAVGSIALLAMALLFRYPTARLLRTGLLALAALLIANAYGNRSLYSGRNFYGSLQVREADEGGKRFRTLYNGSTMHGFQFADAAGRREPTAYYARNSGVGLVLEGMRQPERRVGVIGLGVGTLAAYGRPDDVFRFYELNPAVTAIAQRAFTFLGDSSAHVELASGDARLRLQQEPAQNFDLLVLDAFSGDAIPVHLLTQEAFALYRRHLKPDGTLAVHVTNRYLNLGPLVMRTARVAGWKAQTVVSPVAHADGGAAIWVIAHGALGKTVEGNVWTDDRSDLLSVLSGR
jgi:spermidine synthase